MEYIREIRFVRDGASLSSYPCSCSLQTCTQTATVQVLVLDSDTRAPIGKVELCEEHAQQFADQVK